MKPDPQAPLSAPPKESPVDALEWAGMQKQIGESNCVVNPAAAFSPDWAWHQSIHAVGKRAKTAPWSQAQFDSGRNGFLAKAISKAMGHKGIFFVLLFRLSFVSVCPPASVELARPRPLPFFSRAQQPSQPVFKALQTAHIVSRLVCPSRSVLIVRCVCYGLSFLGHHQKKLPAIGARTLQLTALSVPSSERLFWMTH
jgi:hypothetical protein